MGTFQDLKYKKTNNFSDSIPFGGVGHLHLLKNFEKEKSSDIPIFVKLLYQAVKLHKCETKKFKISHCVILYHHRPPTLCI